MIVQNDNDTFVMVALTQNVTFQLHFILYYMVIGYITTRHKNTHE